MTLKDKHQPREYHSVSWPYWRQSSAYCGWNLSGAWYVYQLWECAVHHQKRAAASKNFGPMGTQAVEWSTKNCSCSNLWNIVGALRRGRRCIHSLHSDLWWNLGASLHTRDEIHLHEKEQLVMLFMKIIVVYPKNHIKCINIPNRQLVELK